MSWQDRALPVGHLARANAILLLWACPPTLDRSFELLKAWGALYKTELIWDKRTKGGKRRMGPGYRSRGMHESILLGVFANERQIHEPFYGAIEGIAREHSRKPEILLRAGDRPHAGPGRCDLFGRQSRAGFDVWGNEATKFDEVAA
jgi:N6-adenosine-specific RNA methylase IME4